MTSVAFEPPLPQLEAALAATLADPRPQPFGARIETVGVRAIISRWERAVLTDGVWRVSLDAPIGPVEAGMYQIVWRTQDPDPPTVEIFVPLIVA